MRPDVDVRLPDHGEVEFALVDLLRQRGNRPLRASDAYSLLAEHFGLDWKHLSVKTPTEGRSKWENICRTARGHMVKSGRLKREPKDSWSLTDDYHQLLESGEEWLKEFTNDASRT